LSSLPLKGNSPVDILYNNIPRAHTSAGKLYYYLLTISGAIYDGVPQNIFNLLYGSIAMENLN